MLIRVFSGFPTIRITYITGALVRPNKTVSLLCPQNVMINSFKVVILLLLAICFIKSVKFELEIRSKFRNTNTLTSLGFDFRPTIGTTVHP